MNQSNGEKIVDFSMCKSCAFYNCKDDSEQCHYCLETPARPYSTIPLNYKYDAKVEKENNKGAN